MLAAVLACTQSSFQPLPQAWVASVKPCGSAPRYWMSSGGRPASAAALRIENGSTSPPPVTGWWNTDLPLRSRSGCRSPYPRTPRSEPK
jgi:hypothetical protein